jgi:hypothetical protein
VSRLRITVAAPDAAPEDSVFVGYREEVNVSPQPVPFDISSSGFQGRDWRTELTLSGAARAIGGVEVSVEGGMASRRITVETRLPDGGWRLARAEETPTRDDRVSLTWPPVRTDAVRVKVWGADPPNVPVSILALNSYPTRFVYFSPPASPATWVAYGDPFMRASAPAVQPVPFRAAVTSVVLQSPEPNPWDRGEPGLGLEWAKRRPWFIPVVMVALLVVVAIMVLRWRPTDDATA